MSRSLIRISLWALLAVIVLAFVRETLEEGPLKLQSEKYIEVALVASLLLLAASLILFLFEKLFGGPGRNRCAVCRKRIPKPEMYCRNHLRDVINEEYDRSHLAD